MIPARGLAGQAWAVLSIRHILTGKDVASSSNCNLFSSKDEAVAFANKVAALNKNWVIRVGQIPILNSHVDGTLPEEGDAFSNN